MLLKQELGPLILMALEELIKSRIISQVQVITIKRSILDRIANKFHLKEDLLKANTILSLVQELTILRLR